MKDAILEAFYPVNTQERFLFFGASEREKLNGLLEGLISQTVIERYKGYHGDALDKAKNYVSDEKFLDSIITRIKNKQLN